LFIDVLCIFFESFSISVVVDKIVAARSDLAAAQEMAFKVKKKVLYTGTPSTSVIAVVVVAKYKLFIIVALNLLFQ
jgi:hypothetical protein